MMSVTSSHLTESNQQRSCMISEASDPTMWKPRTLSSLALTTTFTSSLMPSRPRLFFMGLQVPLLGLSDGPSKPLYEQAVASWKSF